MSTSSKSTPETDIDGVVKLVDIAGPTMDNIGSLDFKGKWISLRITGIQANFSGALFKFFGADACPPWDMNLVEAAELVILEPPHSSEPGSGWEQAADHPRHALYTFENPDLPALITQAISLMTNLDYLHLQLDGLTPSQANTFENTLWRTSNKWTSVQILRLSGISRQASNIHINILRKNCVPNLIGLDMGGIPAGSPLWLVAAGKFENLRRLAIAVDGKSFPLSPAPTIDGFQEHGGGDRCFQNLEWLAIDEFETRFHFDEDVKKMGDYFTTKNGQFISHLKAHLPYLTRLRLTIRKRAVKQARLAKTKGTDQDIDKWYKRNVEDFQQNLPNLESVCIFSDWPWYYEGGKRCKSVEKKNADLLPFRAVWPVGLRDDMPVDGVDDGDTEVGDASRDVDMVD